MIANDGIILEGSTAVAIRLLSQEAPQGLISRPETGEEVIFVPAGTSKENSGTRAGEATGLACSGGRGGMNFAVNDTPVDTFK